MRFSIIGKHLLIAIFCIGIHGFSAAAGSDYESNKIVISVVGGIQLQTFDAPGRNPISCGYASIDELVARHGISKLQPFYQGILKTEIMRNVVGRMYVLTIENPADLHTAIAALSENSLIEFAEPEYINYLDYVPDDPMIPSWYQLDKLDSYIAWDYIRGDSTARAILGIVDSGVYYDHPDLEPNMWINAGEDINGDGRFTNDDINGLDDDGNGYVDDVVGYDIAMNDPYPMEPIPWHGTHVAGCATMATDNGYGGAATGWAARIMAVKVARDSDPNSITHGYAGIIYAAENGCNVINLSWGRPGSYSQSEQNVINAAYDLGVVIVAAAGNDNTSSQHWPAAYDHVLCVAATDADDHKASFSNYGTWIDVSAPGVNVVSTWDHGSFTALSGTSMSSPVTAGAVCLLRAANPGWSVDSVVSHIMFTADNIDDLNPGYRGLLGTGRVNAAAAIGRDTFPRIEIRDVRITLTEDDGDGILNPSESFEVVVTLLNAWSDAFNVVGTLRSDEYFSVTDSTGDFGDISGNGGNSNNSGSPFAVTAEGDAPVGEHEFTLAISADGYSTEATFSIRVSLEQQGFPGDIPDVIESSPVIFDFDQDGSNEIVISANDHKFYSFESNGSITPGWPVEVDDMAPNGAAIGDIDDDGDYEVVGASRAGSIYAWSAEGSLLEGFPYDGGPNMFATPSLSDIDGDGDLEIIAAGFGSKQVYVLDDDGSDYPGWPFQGTAFFFASGAMADIDNDELPEIIFCDFNGLVHVWNADGSYVPGFPATLSGPVQASPAVADIDGDGNLNIVVATFSGNVYALDSDGSTLAGWPVSIGANIKSSPSLSDIDLDGHLEIIFGDNGGQVSVLNSNGQAQSGFPVSPGGSVAGSPVIGDIDGDEHPDIIVGSSDGYIYGYDWQGQPLQNFPILTITRGSMVGSAGLADLDGDGDPEIVMGVRSSGNNLEVIDYKTQITDFDFPWPFYCKDKYRSAFYGDFVTEIDEDNVDFPRQFALYENYPNPFNANTIIRFSLPSEGDVDLTVFDILGRRIRNIISGRLEAGIHEHVWNGTDDRGIETASGVYFYRLKYGQESSTRRMLMIK